MHFFCQGIIFTILQFYKNYWIFASNCTFTKNLQTRVSEVSADTAYTVISISPRATGLIGNMAGAETYFCRLSFWAFITETFPLFPKTNWKALLCASKTMTCGEKHEENGSLVVCQAWQWQMLVPGKYFIHVGCKGMKQICSRRSDSLTVPIQSEWTEM